MQCRKYQSISMPLLAFLCLFLAGGPARADIELGFQSGLRGWSTLGDSGTVTASGGLATITESTFAGETDLYMNFTVPTSATFLQFNLVSVSPDSTTTDNIANGYAPDFFEASLLNPNTGNSLVARVDPTTDSFYTRDVVAGVTQGQAATGVTVSNPPGVLEMISLDVSSLTGQTAEILFRLTGGTDPSNSTTVTLSDVNVLTQSTIVVPEPNSFIAAVLGIVSWIGYRRFLMRSAA